MFFVSSIACTFCVVSSDQGGGCDHVVGVVCMCCVCGVLCPLSSCSLVSLMSYMYVYIQMYMYMSASFVLLIFA